MPVTGSNSNYTITGSNPADIGFPLLTRDYLLDVYPSLVNTWKQSGLWSWGSSSTGQLGDNIPANLVYSPVQTISGGTNWKQIGPGYMGGAAIKTDGTLWTWGQNSTATNGSGQLGDNTTTVRSSPVQTIASGTNWRLVSAGWYHMGAIKTDNSLWMWGGNSNGQLGDNSIIHKSSPVQTVAGGTNWKQLACGQFHTAAIKIDGTLWAWGNNFQGPLGDNTSGASSYKSSPVQTVAGGTNWKQLAVRCSAITAAIKTDGTLWIWGGGGFGGLGDSTTISKSSPVQTVAGGTNWKMVSCGNYYASAIKTDGTLWSWGHNAQGALGDNTSTHKSSPVQTVAGGTNWKFVACGYYTTGAIKVNGSLWTWGNNSNGNLGDNTGGATTQKSSPVQTIAGGTNWKQIALGRYFATAIRDDSTDIFGDPI